MSKLFINILDKCVCIIVFTAITTQALQFAGIIEGPKSLGEIKYEHDNNEMSLAIDDDENRGKRETEITFPMNIVFRIPKAAIQAVDNFLHNAKPALEKLHEMAEVRLKKANEAHEEEFMYKSRKRKISMPTIRNQS